MTTYFPNDETSWALLALILIYAMFNSGVQFSLPAVGAMVFIGYIIIGTAQQHH
ncbi:MAG: hypothetical protein ABIG96_03470 [Candidatus Micrarchaeota archaeon]